MKRSELMAGVDYACRIQGGRDRWDIERVRVVDPEWAFPALGQWSATVTIDGEQQSVTRCSTYLWPGEAKPPIGVLYRTVRYVSYRWEPTGRRFEKPWQKVVDLRNRRRAFDVKDGKAPPIEPGAELALVSEVTDQGEFTSWLDSQVQDVTVEQVDVSRGETPAVGFDPGGGARGVLVRMDGIAGSWWVYDLAHLRDRSARDIDQVRRRKQQEAERGARREAWRRQVRTVLDAVGPGLSATAGIRAKAGYYVSDDDTRLVTFSDGQLAALLDALGGGERGPAVADLIAEGTMRLLQGIGQGVPDWEDMDS